MAAFSNPDAYENWMGRWSARLAPDFVRFTDLRNGGRVLDVGAGTGVLAHALLGTFPHIQIVGIEPSAAYVAHARAQHADKRVSFQVGDAQALPFADDAFDAALSLLVLQEIPDAPQAVAEMRRVTRAGGGVAACQWDFLGGMAMVNTFWQAVQDVCADTPAAQEAASRTPSGYSTCEALARLWSEVGLQAVHTARLEIAMAFPGFNDYWQPFLSGATPTSSFAGTLPPAAQETLARTLRERLLGNGPDRPFTLPAAALAVRGIVP